MKALIKNYKVTIGACYVGYVCQAIVNNFAPLLFVTFGTEFGISLAQITVLITVNFAIQLSVDLLSAKLIDRIGYRTAGVCAHLFIGTGLILMGALPRVVPSPLAGLIGASAVYSVGGGMLEVMVSPLVEGCPTKGKSASMSLLHSFYCWGSVLVIGLTTAVFARFGTTVWDKMSYAWAALPFLNALFFLFIPIPEQLSDGTRSRVLPLLRSGVFWVLVVMMFSAGASELAVAQWASSFVEKGLGVSKTLGDLLGPCLFAVFMGTVRVAYAPIAKKLGLSVPIAVSAGLCVISYLMMTLSDNAALSLVGCALCGVSVALMWPASFSKAAASLPSGGTAMFALLALAGDLGCLAGPALVGRVSSAHGDDLHIGILSAIAFPAVLFVAVWVLKFLLKKREKNSDGDIAPPQTDGNLSVSSAPACDEADGQA